MITSYSLYTFDYELKKMTLGSSALPRSQDIGYVQHNQNLAEIQEMLCVV